MRRERIYIIEVECRRCGKLIHTANRSFYGADALKAELGSICSACTAPEEKERILRGTASAILGRIV